MPFPLPFSWSVEWPSQGGWMPESHQEYEQKNYLSVGTFRFGWISPDSSGYQCGKFSCLGWVTQLHICTLERHCGHRQFNWREPRQGYNLPLPQNCQQYGTKREKGEKEGQPGICSTAAPEGSRSEQELLSPSTTGWPEEPVLLTLWWQISWNRARLVRSGLHHNTALFTQTALHRALCSCSSCDPDFF